MLIDQTGQTLLAAGDYAKANRHFSNLTALDPDNPATSLGLCLALAGTGRFSEALVAIEHARSQAPTNIDLLAAQANLHEQMGDEAKALQCYLDLLTRDPSHLPAAHNLGSLLYRLGYFTEAALQHRETLHRHPKSFATWRDLGQALVAGDELEEGLSALAKAYQLAPGDRDNRFAYGLALLRAEHWVEGWPLYEARWLADEQPPGFPGIPHWQGEALAGKHLVIFAEQGYGDTLMFSRYLPLLTNTQTAITLIVPTPLESLLESSFPEINVVSSIDTSQMNADYTIPLGTIPLRLLDYGVFRPPNNLPYLKPSQHAKKNISDFFTEPLLKNATALIWKGNPTHPADRKRSTTLSNLLKHTPHGSRPLISLQISPNEEEQKQLLRQGIIDASEYLSDFDHSAALLTKIRRLVTVDTAGANLAGALNIPFTLLNRPESEWRWGATSTGTAWYSSCIDKHILP